MNQETELVWNGDKWVRERLPQPERAFLDEIDVEIKKDADLVFYEGEDKVLHFTDYLLEKASSGSVAKCFRSGFYSFDEKIGGIQTGEVVVISGNTKNGKTLFAESWIHSILKTDGSIKAMYLSFEVQTEKLLIKYMGDETLQIYVPRQLKTMDFDWLIDRCREARLKYGCDIVLIDHLHFLVDMNTKLNMSLNIGAVMRKLKHEVALAMNMAVVLIAHQGQPREGKDAMLGNIRDSSFISQEADSVIIVSRRENYNQVELKDFEMRYGEEKLFRIKPPEGSEDKYSSNLAFVKIECSRRTGVFEYRKLFQKVGHFMEEV